jgi:hypothetical protein
MESVPQGYTAAQLRLSYCVATLLIDGEVFVDEFTEDKLTDPARMALAREGRRAARPCDYALGRNCDKWCASKFISTTARG